MEYTEHYENTEERNAFCTTAESNGFRMLHDDFDPDWERGDEPHGTLTFTDQPPPIDPTPPPRDYGKEIDAINERLKVVEKR